MLLWGAGATAVAGLWWLLRLSGLVKGPSGSPADYIVFVPSVVMLVMGALSLAAARNDELPAHTPQRLALRLPFVGGEESGDAGKQGGVAAARLREKCSALRRRLCERVGEQSLFRGGNSAHGNRGVERFAGTESPSACCARQCCATSQIARAVFGVHPSLRQMLPEVGRPLRGRRIASGPGTRPATRGAHGPPRDSSRCKKSRCVLVFTLISSDQPAARRVRPRHARPAQ